MTITKQAWRDTPEEFMLEEEQVRPRLHCSVIRSGGLVVH